MSEETNPTIRLRLQADRCVMLVDGELRAAAVQAALPDAAGALSYYHYDQFHVHVTNSPGGEIAGLEILEAFLLRARQRGVRISTSALYRAHSATSLLVALGDPGQRYAVAGTTFLFHNSRHLLRKDTVLLPEHLPQLQAEASRFASRYPRLLAARAAGVAPLDSDLEAPVRTPAVEMEVMSPAINASCAAAVEWARPAHPVMTEDAYAELFRQDVAITAADAREWRLIDHILTGTDPVLEGIL